MAAKTVFARNLTKVGSCCKGRTNIQQHWRPMSPLFAWSQTSSIHHQTYWQRYFCASTATATTPTATTTATSVGGNAGSAHRFEKMNDVIVNFSEMENHLLKYKEMIGNDYDGYRGHIYRVFNFVNQLMPNLSGKDEELIGVSLVYHDIGLWSHKELSYIDPSIEYFMENVNKINKEMNKKEYNENELLLMHHCIKYHHKITRYNPKQGNKLNERYPLFVKIVDCVRNADLIDFSKGKLKRGIDSQYIDKVLNTIPNNGFHDTLNRLAFEYSDRKPLTMINQMKNIYYW